MEVTLPGVLAWCVGTYRSEINHILIAAGVSDGGSGKLTAGRLSAFQGDVSDSPAPPPVAPPRPAAAAALACLWWIESAHDYNRF